MINAALLKLFRTDSYFLYADMKKQKEWLLHVTWLQISNTGMYKANDCPMQKWHEGIGDQMLWRALHVHVQSFLHGAKTEVWVMLQIPEHRLCTSLKTRFKKNTRWVLYSCLPQIIKELWRKKKKIHSRASAQYIKNNLLLIYKYFLFWLNQSGLEIGI